MNLSELIDLHRGGRSYVELARDCGGTPTAKRLQQLVRGSIKNFPDPPTVIALAKGLKVSQSAVVLAAAESLGLEVGTSMPRVVELLPARAGDLTEPQAAALAHLVMTIVDAMPDAEDSEDVGERPWPSVAEILEARRQGEIPDLNDAEAVEVWLADDQVAARRTPTGQRTRGQRQRDADGSTE